MGQAEAATRHVREAFMMLDKLAGLIKLADDGFIVNVSGTNVVLPPAKVAEIRQEYATLKEQIRSKVLNIQAI